MPSGEGCGGEAVGVISVDRAVAVVVLSVGAGDFGGSTHVFASVISRVVCVAEAVLAREDHTFFGDTRDIGVCCEAGVAAFTAVVGIGRQVEPVVDRTVAVVVASVAALVQRR